MAGAIDCALAQSSPKKEIVVVTRLDDDVAGSHRALRRPLGIIDHRIKARSPRAIAACRHDRRLVILLDADDLLAPGGWRAWQRLVPVVRQGAIRSHYHRRDGKSLRRKFCNFDDSYDSSRVRASFQRTGTYRWPVSAGNAYSRWFADCIFPLLIEHGPDGTLNTLAPLYGEVITIPSALGFYRIHGNNRWSSTGSDFARLPQRIGDRLKELAVMQEHAQKRGVPLPAWPRFQARRSAPSAGGPPAYASRSKGS